MYNLHQLEFELFGIEAVEFFLRVRPAGDEGGHCGGGDDRISWPSTTATRKGSLRSSRCIRLQKANGRVIYVRISRSFAVTRLFLIRTAGIKEPAIRIIR